MNLTLFKRTITKPIKCSPGRASPSRRVPIYKIVIADPESNIGLHRKHLNSEKIAFVLISQTLNALKKINEPIAF